MAPVNSYFKPSAPADEADAATVGREDLSDQLVEAVALSGVGEVVEQPAADALSAGAALDVQHALADLRVVVARVRVRNDAAPPDDLAVGLCDEQRVSLIADPVAKVLGRVETGLEGRDAILDALVVDGGDRLRVAGLRGPYCRLLARRGL